MPLDVAAAPKTLTSTLHYLKRGTEKPARYRIEPPPGVPRWNGTDDPHDVTIEDARGREAEFTLDRNGFALVKAPTAVADFYSPEEIKRVYYPEVERLLRDELGASRVCVFDHNVRNATREGLAVPSRQVHNDHTVNSAPRRVRDHLGADAEELLKHRFGIVNVWRPIRGPVQDSPLALCDARSFTDDDLIASVLSTPMCAARPRGSRTTQRTAGTISRTCSLTRCCSSGCMTAPMTVAHGCLSTPPLRIR